MKQNRIISTHEIAQIEEDISTRQKSLHALTNFFPGEIISFFSAGEKYARPNYLTVQKGDNLHISLVPEFLQYINHDCDPNCFFDTETMKLICLKPIKPGDELTFFYPSSEWEMAQPFYCHCGSTNCLKMIKGAAYLPEEILGQYKLTDFIQQKLAARKQSAA